MTSPIPRTNGAENAALAVTGLSWGVGGLVIVDDVTLAVAPGEFVTVIGPNGAGKTSLINLISGVYSPRAGKIELFGEDITALRPADRTQRGIGRTFQTSSLFPGLTVAENVRLSAQAAIGDSLRLLRSPRPGDEASTRVDRVLEEVGLSDRKEVRAAELPHGDKRKLELALVLVAEPKVLLLDEPTAGVSLEETRPLVELIQRVHASGRSVVMVEHRIEFVVDVSDRVAVMHEGGLLALGTPAEIMADERVRAAYLGGLH